MNDDAAKKWTSYMSIRQTQHGDENNLPYLAHS